MHHPALSQDIATAAQEALAFVAWLATGDELIDAALLLGGRKWQAVAQRVAMQARNGVAIERVLPDLRRLARLLMLDYTSDFSSVEATLFLSVHPDDPRADNARICAEAMVRGLAALELAHPITIKEAV